MGGAHVMPLAVVWDVLHVSPYVPVIPIEDAFVGICINQLDVSVEVVNFGKHFVREFKGNVLWFLATCILMKSAAPVCVHGVTPLAMTKLQTCLDESKNGGQIDWINS